MEVKQIQFNELSTVLFDTFNGDEKLLIYFDPTVSIYTIEGIVDNIEKKISDYISIFKEVIIFSVINKNKTVGYFIYNNKMLISFGLNIDYRTIKKSLLFFNLIKSQIGSNFYCTLYSVNTRAINWLIKMGLKIEANNLLTTKLIQCQ